MNKYRFWFHGRKLGAIGVTYTIGPFEGQGETVLEAQKAVLAEIYRANEWDLYIQTPVKQEMVTGG